MLCAVMLCLHHAVYADDDEGNAEELPHIEKHATFKLHLLNFEELDEETEGKDGGKAISEVEASADGDGRGRGLRLSFVPLVIDDYANDEDEQIGKSLIELGWMARHSLPIY